MTVSKTVVAQAPRGFESYFLCQLNSLFTEGQRQPIDDLWMSDKSRATYTRNCWNTETRNLWVLWLQPEKKPRFEVEGEVPEPKSQSKYPATVVSGAVPR